jgi:hypothetical protein
VDKGDVITLIGGLVTVLVLAVVVNPHILASPLSMPGPDAAPAGTPGIPPTQVSRVTAPPQQPGTVADGDPTRLPTTVPAPQAPARILYSTRAVEVPRYTLPGNMNSFGASDVIPWEDTSLVPYLYLQESAGGITQEFRVPYEVSVINITSLAKQDPTYARLRMVVCDAKDGTILTGIETFHGESAQKKLLRPKNDVYIIVSETSVDQFQITFETPAEYYNPVSGPGQSPAPQEISGVSTMYLEAAPTVRTFDYVLRGINGHIDYPMYGGVNHYLANQPVTRYRQNNKSAIQSLVSNDIQDYYLSGLVQKIQAKTDNKDDQARIAISLVQQLYYNTTKLNRQDQGYEVPYQNFPYSTLYSGDGLCLDKSLLLSYLLKELGYGVEINEYTPTDPNKAGHAAVGIRAPGQYSQYTDNALRFAYVETTCPGNIPTSVPANVLSDARDPIPISDGLSFNSVNEEYADALQLKSLDNKLNHDLAEKYGFIRLYPLPKKICS